MTKVARILARHFTGPVLLIEAFQRWRQTPKTGTALLAYAIGGKKSLPLLLVASLSLTALAQEAPRVKTGWNFGVLPSVAFDADYGFQGGLLGNIYYYGDGSQYPEYIHSLYAEGAYTTKGRGIFRLNYDSRYLIPRHGLTIDVTYLPDAMCDFYGFNGYQSRFNSDWCAWSNDPAEVSDAYRSRAFYKMKRDLFRLAGDINGTLHGPLRWNAGAGLLYYRIDKCDIERLNGDNIFNPALPRSQQKPLDPDMRGLYEQYCAWGLIDKAEAHGGWHPYLRGGISLDTRDKRTGPSRGIYADAFVTYSAAFGEQRAYNHLQLNLTFRHYVPLVGHERLTLAYRIGTQNLLAGQSPFYMKSYLNTQFIQRVIYEGLGGANSLRGILASRICADGFLYANVELRSRIAAFDIGRQRFYIGLNPFFDLGMVTQPYRQKEIEVLCSSANGDLSDYFWEENTPIYRPHIAAGMGLKVGMNENFVFSVEWATPLGDRLYRQQDNDKVSNLYIKMGYLF